MHEIIENKWYDPEFIEKWTYGFDELAERVKDWTPERAAEICQVNVEDIREAARYMGTHGPVAMCIGLGPGCMHTNAIQNGRAIACLQGMLGHLDVVGGIPVPLSFSVMLDDKITLWDSAKDPVVLICLLLAEKSIRSTSPLVVLMTLMRYSRLSSLESLVLSRLISPSRTIPFMLREHEPYV